MALFTKEEVLKTGEPDPEFMKSSAETIMPPLTSIADVRKGEAGFINMVKQILGPPPPEIRQSDHEIPTSAGSTVRARVYQPATPPSTGSPLIVIFHGGGFCLGFLELMEGHCRSYVKAFGAVCVSCEYRKAPEFPFPAGMQDAWDGLRWAADNAKSLGADPALGFVVGGESAGGNLAAVLAHIARDENLQPPLTGQYLSIPAVLAPDVVPEKYQSQYLAREQNKDAPGLDDNAIKLFEDFLKPDYHDYRYIAFNHPKGHGGLPPAYFQVCGLDPLRDDALIYESVLREEEGIKTRLDMYSGLPHAFWVSSPQLTATAKFWDDTVQGMGWLLGRVL